MGRTLPPASQLILQQIDEIKPLYEALRRSDQLILDQIFEEINPHRAAIANAANLLPLESMLILALLEQHKKFSRIIDELYREIDALKSKS
ncbi:MAG: hypothetical protein WBW94_00870 [Anaerolineales bacterium]